MSDAALGHHRDGHCLLYALDHLRVAHAGHATGGTYVGRDAFQGHHGAGAGVLCNLCLFGGCHIHNHTALEHLRQVAVECLSVFHSSFY